MKKRRNNFRKILNEIFNKIFNRRGYKSKQQMRNIIDEMKNREEGASLPPDLAEQYRMDLEEKRKEELEERLERMKEFFEKSREEFDEQKSYRESIKIPKWQLPDHEKAKEDAEKSRLEEENKRISEELRYIAIEADGKGMKSYSNKQLGNKFIIAYGKSKDDKNKVVLEYTRDELIEKSKQREQEQNTQGEE